MNGKFGTIGKIRTAGALAAVALVTAVLMSAAGPAQAADQTLTLVGKRGAFTLPGTPAIGIGFIAGGTLYQSDGTTQAGQAYSNCTVTQVTLAVPPAITAQCMTVFTLSGGELFLGSLRDYLSGGFDKADLAILGGTGSYRTARGDGTAQLTDQASHTYTFTLTITSS